jgi:pimeloyl-ACP methyl ester carboxylesterase
VAKSVRFCQHGDCAIDIAYATHGDPSAPVMVLNGAMASQLVDWNDCLVAALARHFFVVRYDYRDVGNSTKLAHLSGGGCCLFGICATSGPSYTLDDIVCDMWALVDRVAGCDAEAHLVGFGFGGAVAQMAALGQPGRVSSLTLINSSSGDADLPQPAAATMKAIESVKMSGISDLGARLKLHKEVYARGTEVDEGDVLELLERSSRRSTYLDGDRRMLAAMRHAPPRDALWEELAETQPDAIPPTVIIQGQLNVLVPPAHGERLHADIPGSKLVVIPGMAHAVDTAFARPVADAITAVALSAEAELLD